MKKFRFCVSLFTVLSSILSSQSSVLSLPNSIVIKYTQSESPLRINLHNGLGTNISFIDVNESIETIFLDNKSFISLHTNGCLSQDSTQVCPQNSSPTLIHLSTIDPLSLPGVVDVNRLAGQNSLLTVITRDARNKKHSYIFPLDISNLDRGMPHVALIKVSPKPERVFDNIQFTTVESIGRFKTGFNLAIIRGDYTYGSPTCLKIQKFINGLNTGDDFQSAPSYGLPLSLISNLINLGTPN